MRICAQKLAIACCICGCGRNFFRAVCDRRSDCPIEEDDVHVRDSFRQRSTPAAAAAAHTLQGFHFVSSFSIPSTAAPRHRSGHNSESQRHCHDHPQGTADQAQTANTMSGLSKLRAYAGRESPDAVTTRLFVNPGSRRPIPAAEVSIPGANTTDSKTFHRLGTGRLSLFSDDDAEADSFEGQDFSLNAKIATLERANAKLKDENRKFELTTSQLKGDNDKLKSEIDKIKSEGNKLKEDIHNLKGEKIKLEDNNIKLIGDLKDDNALLDGENNKLKGENIKLNGDNEKLKDKNDSLESQLSCHGDLISSLKDEISERGATLKSSRNFAHEVIVGFLTSGYNLPDGLPDHLTATYENAMEIIKSITKELGSKKLPKHDAGPDSSMSPTLSGKTTDDSNGRVRKGPLLDEPVAKRLKRVHDSQCAPQSAGDDETSLLSFNSDTADNDEEEA